MKNIRKDPDTAFWLAFCLGGAGGQHFYLGNTGRGVLYLCFFWTAIPVIVSLIELFSIKEKVRQLNNQNAMQAAQRAKALMAA